MSLIVFNWILITKKNKDFYVKEVLIRHLEGMEDLQTSLERLKKKKLYFGRIKQKTQLCNSV